MSKQQKKYRWLEENAIEVQSALVFLESVLDEIGEDLPDVGYHHRFHKMVDEKFSEFHDSMRVLVDAFDHKLKADAEWEEKTKGERA